MKKEAGRRWREERVLEVRQETLRKELEAQKKAEEEAETAHEAMLGAQVKSEEASASTE